MVKFILSLVIYLVYLILFFLPIKYIYSLNKINWQDFLAENYISNIVFSSLIQTIVSVFIILASAIFIARAFNRRGNFLGKKLILYLFDIILVLPSLIIILAVVDIYGKYGWLSYIITNPKSLYGYYGIILSQVIINLPLNIRIMINGFENIDQASILLAKQLGFNSRAIWLHLEWPTLRPLVKYATMITLINCLMNLSVILIFGGSPANQNIESFIFYALKFDFDQNTAFIMCLLQFIVNSLIIITFLSKNNYNFVRPLIFTNNKHWWDKKNLNAKIFDSIIIAVSIFLLIMPLITIISKSFAGTKVIFEKNLWLSIYNSLIVAINSTLIASLITTCILVIIYYFSHIRKNFKILNIVYLLANLGLIFSPLVWTAALFLWSNSSNYSISPKLIIVIANVNILISYQLSVLKPMITNIKIETIRLSENLRIRGYCFFNIVIWPVIKRSYIYVIATCLMFSFSNLGVTILFGNNDYLTLPYYLYTKIGSYKINEASTIAGLMLVMMLVINFSVNKMVNNART